MRHHRSPLAIIFLTVFIDLVGFGIVIPVLPLYAERFGASPLVIGMLLGIYSAMQCVAAPLLGKLSDRVGRRPVLLLSILGTSLGFLLMGLASTLPMLFLARIIDGMTGGNISTAQAYIADVTPAHERSRGMGLIGAAFGLGFIFGPAIGGLLSHVSFSAPFFFAAALAAANAVAIYIWLPESLPVLARRLAHAPPRLAQSLDPDLRRTLGPIMAAYFCTTVAFSLLTAIYPLLTERWFGYGPSQNGYIFACQGILSAIVQGVVVGKLIRASHDKAVAIAGATMLAIGLWWLPWSGTVLFLLAATAMTAVGHGLVAAPLNGLASQRAGARSQGRVLGLMQSSASLARVIGPVVGGWLLGQDATALVTPFGRSATLAAAVVMLAALVFAVIL